MNKTYKIIILGPQGSGKGTQAEFLSEKLNIPNISPGQLLRNEIENKTEIGKEAKEYMNKGQLVPNSIVHELAKNRITQPDCENGFIFDGFPRILIQAKFIETVTDITHVLLVDISDQEAVYRLSGRRTCLKCGKVYHIKFNPPKKQGICDECGEKLEIREDDTEEAIRKRLKIYHTETEEVVEYYRDKKLLIEINGEQSIEEVRDEMFEKLKI
ncbi:adenylate kinase [Patescibacteria group bacterium]|nr:adenylate kinase [Patescibacteria group bacterium]